MVGEPRFLVFFNAAVKRSSILILDTEGGETGQGT